MVAAYLVSFETEIRSAMTNLLKAGLIWKVECSVSFRNSVLCKASVICHHFMKGCDSVSLFELSDIVTDQLNKSRNIITRVVRLVHELGPFPVLRVGA